MPPLRLLLRKSVSRLVSTAPAKAEKNVNGDFVLRLKLMNNPVSIGKNTPGFKSVVYICKLEGWFTFNCQLSTR